MEVGTGCTGAPPHSSILLKEWDKASLHRNGLRMMQSSCHVDRWPADLEAASARYGLMDSARGLIVAFSKELPAALEVKPN
jgi:hypothetical protein